MSVTLMRMHIEIHIIRVPGWFRALVCVGLESESRAHTNINGKLVQLAKRSRRNGVLDWPAF